MKQTIYIDVLISVNLFINYFLLLSVTKILDLKLERKRLIISAFIGSLYSLFILLPPINLIFSLVIKLIMSATIVFIAFEVASPRMFLKTLGIFYGTNFLFGGAIFFLWYFVSPNGLFINNNMVYLNLSPLFLVATTFLAYIIIELINRFVGEKSISTTNCDLLISYGNQSVIVKSKVDTGNTLREPFSNIPVIVVQYQSVESVVPEALKGYIYSTKGSNISLNSYESYTFSGLRMIPLRTVSGEGLLPAFKPDYIKILSKANNIKKEAYVAVCTKKIFDDKYQALINPDLME